MPVAAVAGGQARSTGWPVTLKSWVSRSIDRAHRLGAAADCHRRRAERRRGDRQCRQQQRVAPFERAVDPQRQHFAELSAPGRSPQPGRNVPSRAAAARPANSSTHAARAAARDTTTPRAARCGDRRRRPFGVRDLDVDRLRGRLRRAPSARASSARATSVIELDRRSNGRGTPNTSRRRRGRAGRPAACPSSPGAAAAASATLRAIGPT